MSFFGSFRFYCRFLGNVEYLDLGWRENFWGRVWGVGCMYVGVVDNMGVER